MGGDFKKVTVLENEDEASLVHLILNERQIPHLLRSYYDTAFDGLFQTQKGWGHVSGPAAYHETVMEVVLDLRQGARTGEEADPDV